MNFLLHRQKSRCHVLPLPDGLEELMGDISREVLRCQPTPDCTYKFIADYLDSMIETREKSKVAMEIIEDVILKTDEVFNKFIKCRFPKEKTASFINVMEMTFRRFVEQKRKLKEDPRYITFQTDDMLDELIRKCDLTKVEILRSRPAIQWAYKKFVSTYLAAIEGTLDTEDLYLSTDKLLMSELEYEDLNKSAIMIQKAYRGYSTRKNVKKMKLTRLPVTDSFLEFQQQNQEDLTKAAVKIQAQYKGFRVRKEYQLARNYEEDETLIYITNLGPKPEDLNKAAIKIQSTFKGYKVRKELKRQK